MLEQMRATRVPVPGGTLAITVSIGVAAARPGEDMAEIIRRADAALYEAKGRGGDGYHVAAQQPVRCVV
jgi:diguanylate cyclase (GGDEF)-like protein